VVSPTFSDVILVLLQCLETLCKPTDRAQFGLLPLCLINLLEGTAYTADERASGSTDDPCDDGFSSDRVAHICIAVRSMHGSATGCEQSKLLESVLAIHMMMLLACHSRDTGGCPGCDEQTVKP